MKRTVTKLTASLAVAALVIGAGVSLAAGGGGGNQNAKVLGKTNAPGKPFCKDSRQRGSCQVVASLTTYINKLNGKKKPMVVPRNGKIVAWSIELGSKPSNKPFPDDPDSSNLEFFQSTFGNEKYGKGPVGRLAVLRRQNGVNMKLINQSPAVKFSKPYYKRDTVITLDQPMNVREGDIIGFSSLTWTPTLKPRSAQSGANSWRANLGKGECGSDGILKGKPQKRVDSVREYRCEFSDRLFYRAYFVAN